MDSSLSNHCQIQLAVPEAQSLTATSLLRDLFCGEDANCGLHKGRKFQPAPKTDTRKRSIRQARFLNGAMPNPGPTASAIEAFSGLRRKRQKRILENGVSEMFPLRFPQTMLTVCIHVRGTHLSLMAHWSIGVKPWEQTMEDRCISKRSLKSSSSLRGAEHHCNLTAPRTVL